MRIPHSLTASFFIKYVISALLITTGLIMPAQANAEGLISLHVGNFDPGSDYRQTQKEGPNFGIYYTYTPGTFGFEGGMHGYSVSDGTSDIGVVGFEMLVTAQTQTEIFQPYIGLGFGTYSIVIDPAIGSEYHGDGTGLIIEAGLRIYLENTIVGFQIKKFSNKMDDPNSPGDNVDYGGTGATLFMGLIF